jgi:hypothetical protein
LFYFYFIVGLVIFVAGVYSMMASAYRSKGLFMLSVLLVACGLITMALCWTALA